MKFLRKILDKQVHLFEKGGKLERFYPIYEMADTFLYTPASVTRMASHVRDAMDLKRMMLTVIVALIPCILMAMYNTGLQVNKAMAEMTVSTLDSWRGAVFYFIRDLLPFLSLGHDPGSILDNMILGAMYFVPIYIVTQLAGGFWEILFSVVRKHEVNEGFFVTGMLFPLILPPEIPLWQVAIGISFGVVLGKEVFGGTGYNFLNPALTARAFLFFNFPSFMSGEAVWVGIDGFTAATPLAQAAESGLAVLSPELWHSSFMGLIPGSIGETSTLACLLGAVFLIITGVGSWRIMLSVVIGMVLVSSGLNFLAPYVDNPMFTLPWYWHAVTGGFAFGTVFMATDPVSAAMTDKGRYIYGAMIGFMVVMIRVVNPAFPEGMMLAILFANCFAPVIDHFVVRANIKRRRLRNVG